MKPLAALLCVLCTGVAAEPVCHPHEQFSAVLAGRYGETPQVQAMTNTGMMLMIFVNPKTGTWSALQTDATGLACLVAAGTKFYFAPGKVTPDGDPA